MRSALANKTPNHPTSSRGAFPAVPAEPLRPGWQRRSWPARPHCRRGPRWALCVRAFLWGPAGSYAFSAAVSQLLLLLCGLRTEVTTKPESIIKEKKILEVKIWDILVQNLMYSSGICVRANPECRSLDKHFHLLAILENCSYRLRQWAPREILDIRGCIFCLVGPSGRW